MFFSQVFISSESLPIIQVQSKTVHINVYNCKAFTKRALSSKPCHVLVYITTWLHNANLIDKAMMPNVKQRWLTIWCNDRKKRQNSWIQFITTVFFFFEGEIQVCLYLKACLREYLMYDNLLRLQLFEKHKLHNSKVTTFNIAWSDFQVDWYLYISLWC